MSKEIAEFGKLLCNLSESEELTNELFEKVLVGINNTVKWAKEKQSTLVKCIDDGMDDDNKIKEEKIVCLEEISQASSGIGIVVNVGDQEQYNLNSLICQVEKWKRELGRDKRSRSNERADRVVPSESGSSSPTKRAKMDNASLLVEDCGEMESGGRLKEILTSMATPVIVANAKLEITFVNSSAEEVFGYQQSELLNKNVKMLMNDNDASQHDGYVDRYEKTKQSKIIGKDPRLVQGKHKDGSVLHLYLTITRIEDGGYTAVLTNVTETKNVNLRLESILSSMATPVIMANPKMEITFVNGNAEEIFGYQQSELLNKNVKMLMNDNDASQHDGYVDRYEKTKQSKIIGKDPRLVQGKHKDGSGLHLYLTITRIGDGGYTAVFTNVTEQRKVVLRLERILSAMATPVIISNAQMKITYANKNAISIFGYKESELLSQSVNILMNSTDAQKHDGYVEQYQATGDSTIIGKRPRLVQGRHKDGSILYLYLTITKVEDGGFTAVFTDVTAQLRNADRVAKLESIASAVIVTDKAFQIEYMNPFALTIFQYRNPSEVVGQSIKILLDDKMGQHNPCFLEEFAVEEDRMTVGEDESKCETRSSCASSSKYSDTTGSMFSLGKKILYARTKKGEKILFYFKVTKTCTGFTLSLMDVTRKLAMSAQLSHIMRSVSTSIFVVNDQQTIEYANPFAIKTFGYGKKEIVGKPLTKLLPSVPNAAEYAKKQKEDKKEGEETTALGNLVTGVTKFGNSILLSLSTNKNGKHTHLTLVDVTKSHSLLHKLNSMLEAIPSLMFIYTKNSNDKNASSSSSSAGGCLEFPITLMSRSLHRFVESKQNSYKQFTIGDFVGCVFEEHRPIVKNLFERMLESKVGFSETCECRLASSQYEECAFDAFEILLTKLQHDEVFVIARNIESDVRLREELRDKLESGSSNLRKAIADSDYIRRVFGYVAHEYRNMYFGAQSICSEIQTELAGSSMEGEIAQVIRIHSRMGQLFDDVLLMQKLEANGYQYEQNVFLLQTILDDIIEFAKNQSVNDKISNGVSFKYSIDPKLKNVKIMGSSTHLFQAVTNLLSNAFKYNSINGIVNFSATLVKDEIGENDTIHIEIRDTGLGIPENQRKEIFQPYKRLSTGSHRIGTGLGLTFAKEFIEQGNNGSLGLEDNKIEQIGTTFYIILTVYTGDKTLPPTVASHKPLSESADRSLIPKVDHNIRSQYQEYDVLVIDDDDIIRIMFSRRLRKLTIFGHALRVLEASIQQVIYWMQGWLLFCKNRPKLKTQ